MKLLTVVLGFVASALAVHAGGLENLYVPIADTNKPNCITNKIYSDKEAQLMWQDQSYTDAEDGAYHREHSVVKAGSWSHAKNYCERLDYQGYSDWRLPTSDELMQVHAKKGNAFVYHRSDDFWSSTPATDSRYYVVSPVDAYRYKRKKNQSNYIRCVRCWVAPKKPTVLSEIKKIEIDDIEIDLIAR